MEQQQVAGISPAIDIQRFCATSGDPRNYLSKPWIDDGKTIACNGHVLIALDEVRPDAAPVDAKMAGKVVVFIAQTAAFTTPHVIDIDSMPKDPCRVCFGAGFVHETDCDGDGEFEHGSHTYCCKECEGVGSILSEAARGEDKAQVCTKCHGSGFLADRAVVGASGAGFDSNYLRMIAALPNARLFPGDSHDMARFEFDGGIGFVMPRHR